MNFSKMEEERELISLIRSTWEEMALLPSAAKGDRMGPGSHQAAWLFLLLRCLGLGRPGPGVSVDLAAPHWPWTPDWRSCPSQSPGTTRGEVEVLKIRKDPAQPASRERGVQSLREPRAPPVVGLTPALCKSTQSYRAYWDLLCSVSLVLHNDDKNLIPM